jgi:hypothetical protein
MIDEQTKPDDEQHPDSTAETTADAAADTPSPPEAGEPQQDAASAERASDWPELEEYRTQLQSEHAAWVERLTAVQTQLGSVRPILEQIATQYAALGIEEDIARLCEQVLGGAGMLQRVRFDFDLERYVTLAWPAPADPRPELAAAHAEGEYRVDVWFGIGADGRGRVRVEGAKRLEAPLPTSRARLRSVLLGAIQAPRYVPSPTTEGRSTEAAGEPPPDNEPVEGATPRPGNPDDQPPPEEQVIPLGPAGSAEGAPAS